MIRIITTKEGLILLLFCMGQKLGLITHPYIFIDMYIDVEVGPGFTDHLDHGETLVSDGMLKYVMWMRTS